MVKEFIHEMMVEFMKDNEIKILCMVKVFISGQMEMNIEDNMFIIKGKDMEFILM